MRFVLGSYSDDTLKLDLVRQGSTVCVPITLVDDTGTVTGIATETTLAKLEAKDFATEATLDKINDNLIHCDTGNVNIIASALPDGAATSAKQLPDGHNITANAGTNLNTSALATEATMTADLQSIEDNQTDGSQKTQIVDSSGNNFLSEPNADGDYHLGSAIIQKIISSTNNSTTSNLNAGATFTGSADTTFGVCAIQVYHFADQDCTIYIDQSLDGTNWDISDEFDCLANNACTRTFYSVAPYYRARLTNNGSSATTILRFATGMTPVISPLPRALSYYDRLKSESSLYDDVTDIRGKITPFGRTKITEPVRVIGTAFSGTTKDTNFWSETVGGTGTTGSVTQAGEITLATSTAADGTALYETVDRARHVSGTANELKFTGRLITAPEADNTRRCGVYDDNDGFYFEVDGTTFGVGSRKGGVDTQVQSGSFNGNYGPSLSMDTSMGNFVIWWWEKTAYFFINGKLLHKMSATTESLVNTNTLPIRMENNNTGSTTNNSFEILTASVTRFGQLTTGAKYYHLSGNAATHILKYGAGTLQKIMFNNTSGTNITIYDNTAGSGTVIGVITTTSNCIGEWTYNVPFSTGLTLVTVGNSLDATIIYE